MQTLYIFLFLIGTISDSFLRTRHYPLSMYDGGGGGEEGGREGVKDYLGGFLKGKEGRISCRRQNMKGNYRKLAANSIT